MPRRPQVRWSEPYRKTLREKLDLFRSLGFLKSAFWCRVVAVTAGITAFMLGLHLWLYPSAPIPWQPFVLALVAGPAYVVVRMTIFAAFRRSIDVSTKRVLITHGPSETHIRPSDLVEVAIVTDVTPSILRITYMTRKALRVPSRRSTVAVEISPSVDLPQLIDVLAQLRAAASPSREPTDAAAAPSTT